MAKITNMVHAILTRIATEADRTDRAEARELLARLAVAHAAPAVATAPRYARRPAKKGGRRG